MKVLLTGGTGFLGSHVAEALLSAGHSVVALVRSTSDTAFLEGLPGVRLVEGALEDEAGLQRAASGVDGVIHAAALVKATRPEAFHRVNTEGTARLLRAAIAGCPPGAPFIFVSSLAAHGPSPDGTPVSADTAPGPVTQYGHSKRAAEAVVADAADALRTVTLCPAMIYGPRDVEVFPFFRSVGLGVVPMTNAPTSRLSSIYATDCAAACVRALEADVPSGSRFFLDDGMPLTLGEMIEAIRVATGRRRLIRVPIPGSVLQVAAVFTELFGRVAGRAVMLTRDKVNEVRAPHWVCDSWEARGALGWEPEVDFTEGAVRAVDWYRQVGWL